MSQTLDEGLYVNLSEIESGEEVAQRILFKQTVHSLPAGADKSA